MLKKKKIIARFTATLPEIKWSQHESVLIGTHEISKDGRAEDNLNIAGFDLVRLTLI